MWSRTNFSDEVRGLPTPYLILTGEHDIEGLRAAPPDHESPRSAES